MNVGKCPICGNMNLEQINDELIYSKCHLCGWVSKKYKIIHGTNTGWVETSDFVEGGQEQC